MKKVGFLTENPFIDMKFNEKVIPFKNVSDNADIEDNLTELFAKYWDRVGQGGYMGKFKSQYKLIENFPCQTVTASKNLFHPHFKRRLNKKEKISIQTFPIDYNFNDTDFNYMLGMSVPPVMMAQIATRVYNHWLSKIK